VRCVLPDQASLKTSLPKFAPSAVWLDGIYQDWSKSFGSKFWLTDLNGDGFDDLVIPSPGGLGLLVAYSNGQNGFASMVPLVSFSSAVNYSGVAFGDVNGDGLTDLTVWTPNTILLYTNNGKGFNQPSVASVDFPESEGWGLPQYISTMQLADMDADGCAD